MQQLDRRNPFYFTDYVGREGSNDFAAKKVVFIDAAKSSWSTMSSKKSKPAQ